MEKYQLSTKKKSKLMASIAKARTVPAPENSLGQWIGYFIDEGTSAILEEFCPLISTPKQNIDFKPKEGDRDIKLLNTLGQSKQIDHVITINSQIEIIVESKWLKDKRHLNDKGAWILMMNDILSHNTYLKGIIVILAGPWEGMRPAIEKRAKTIIIPEDFVYEVLSKYGISIEIDPIRNAYKNAGGMLNTLLDIIENEAKTGYDLVKEIGYQIISNKKDLIKKGDYKSSCTRL